MSTIMTKRRGRPRVDDSYLYDADAVDVGILLFGERPCADCRLPLPACTDYFTPSGGGLKSSCKRCVNEKYRESNAQRRQRYRNEEKAVRLVAELCARTARMLDLRGLVRP